MCWSLPLDLIRRWCGVAGIKAVPCFISSWGSCGAGPNVNYTLGINCCKVYISSIIRNPAGVRGLEAGAVGWAPVPSSARPSCCYFSPCFCQRTEITWLERQNIPPCAAHLFPRQTAWGGRVISMTEQRTLVFLQSQGDHGVALVGCLHSALPPRIAAGP